MHIDILIKCKQHRLHTYVRSYIRSINLILKYVSNSKLTTTNNKSLVRLKFGNFIYKTLDRIFAFVRANFWMKLPLTFC